MAGTKKELGQHWLKDRLVLESIADCAQLSGSETVLEIGPGLGTLTSVLLSRASQVIAVEFDPDLAHKLPGQFPGKNLVVVHSDILSYDLTALPEEFVAVGNIPYYITNKIIHKLSEGPVRPVRAVLLVQKEVAERLAARPGEMSLMSISAQLFHEVELGPIVRAEMFIPPPKVNSQVVVLKRRTTPLVADGQRKAFFRLVKAGFSARRKKLRSSLSGGLHIDKGVLEKILVQAKVSPDQRAEDLRIEEWLSILKFIKL